jgi:hypothetical protein
MSVRVVPLRHVRPAWAALRPLCGHDEEAITESDTRAAVTLLDRLLADVPGTGCPPGSAAALTASDRDRLLAAVYAETYGDRVAGTPACAACGQTFDLSFSLGALLAHADADDQDRQPVEDGAFQTASGVRFRLPVGADEIAVAALPPDAARQALLARIAPDASDEDAEAIEEALETLAPILDLELAAVCPECGAAQTVPFDVQRYLLESLRGEWRLRGAEVHRLASTYGWGLGDILGLPRPRRRDFVGLAEAELPAARTRSTWRRTYSA